jgi:hypothetical protein
MTWVPHPARPVLHCRLHVFLEIVLRRSIRKSGHDLSTPVPLRKRKGQSILAKAGEKKRDAPITARNCGSCGYRAKIQYSKHCKRSVNHEFILVADPSLSSKAVVRAHHSVVSRGITECQSVASSHTHTNITLILNGSFYHIAIRYTNWKEMHPGLL